MKDCVHTAAKEVGFYESSEQVVPAYIVANQIFGVVFLHRPVRPNLLETGDLG
jgi:hypothetical protein